MVAGAAARPVSRLEGNPLPYNPPNGAYRI
jgi:hypothetical protein